jgi:hypothetical protein
VVQTQKKPPVENHRGRWSIRDWMPQA